VPRLLASVFHSAPEYSAGNPSRAIGAPGISPDEEGGEEGGRRNYSGSCGREQRARARASNFCVRRCPRILASTSSSSSRPINVSFTPRTRRVTYLLCRICTMNPYDKQETTCSMPAYAEPLYSGLIEYILRYTRRPPGLAAILVYGSRRH